MPCCKACGILVPLLGLNTCPLRKWKKTGIPTPGLPGKSQALKDLTKNTSDGKTRYAWKYCTYCKTNPCPPGRKKKIITLVIYFSLGKLKDMVYEPGKIFMSSKLVAVSEIIELYILLSLSPGKLHCIMYLKISQSWDFPGSPVVKNPLAKAGDTVRSLVWKLRSHRRRKQTEQALS